MGGGIISSSSKNLPVSGNSTKPCCSDLVALNPNPNEDITTNDKSFSNSVFGSVPSQSEVELAISLLKDFIRTVSSSNGSESKWAIEMLDSPTSRLLVSYGLGKVCEAFQLLQLDPSFKKLVISLASDKALWEAILSNELVRKLGVVKSQETTENGSRKSTNEEPDLATKILLWMYKIAKAKLIEFMEKFRDLVNEILQNGGGGMERTSRLEDYEEHLKHKVTSSLLLSVVILLIIVVARASRG